MSQGNGPSLCGRGAAAIAAVLTLAGAPTLAHAQQQQQQRPQAAPQRLYPVASGASRYATPDGAVRFVLDRSGGRAALVRFEGDPEVHVLRPTMGAGGDEIYQTEDGAVRLRVTPHGGHCAFLERPEQGYDGYWAEREIVRFVTAAVSALTRTDAASAAARTPAPSPTLRA